MLCGAATHTFNLQDALMKSLLCTFGLFGLVLVSVYAADEKQAKPTPLTPNEIADGWILVFDGETTFGWTVEGDANVVDGVLELGGEKETRAMCTACFGDGEFLCDCSGHGHISVASGKDAAGFDVISRDQNMFFKVQMQIERDPQEKGVSLRKKGPGADYKVAYSGSCVTFRVDAAAGQKVFLREAKVKPGGLKSIFNGKDLTGW